MKALFRAVGDKYKEATSLVTQIGPIYLSQVPHAISKPYTIVTLVGGETPHSGFQGSFTVEGAYVQFAVFDTSQGASPSAVTGFGELIKTRFDWVTLTWTDAPARTDLKCQRVTPGEVAKDPTGAWMFRVDYIVRFED